MEPLAEGEVAEFLIVLTSPEAVVSSWPGSSGSGTCLVRRTSLLDGRTLWVVSRIRGAMPGEATNWQDLMRWLQLRLRREPGHVTGEPSFELRAQAIIGPADDGSWGFLDIWIPDEAYQQRFAATDDKGPT